MNSKTTIIRLTFVLTLLSLAGCSKPGAPDPATQTLFKNLMAATMSRDYDGFLAECDAVMKASLTKPMMERVSDQIVPRAQQGYETQYLGDLNQHGYKVNLWKLSFKGGGDDILATVSIKDGKAGGFLLR